MKTSNTSDLNHLSVEMAYHQEQLKVNIGLLELFLHERKLERPNRKKRLLEKAISNLAMKYRNQMTE